MAVKKGILANFLKPSTHYSDNQKNLRSIFIDKSEEDLIPDNNNFLETSLTASESITDVASSPAAPQINQTIVNREQTGNKSGTNREQIGDKPGTNREHIENTITKINKVDHSDLQKARNNPDVNREQTGNKSGTELKQPVSPANTHKEQIKKPSLGDAGENTLVDAKESGYKPGTNREQTGNRVTGSDGLRISHYKEIEPVIYREHTGNISGTSWEQTTNKLTEKPGTYREHTGNQKTHGNDKLETNRKQTRNQIGNTTGNISGTYREQKGTTFVVKMPFHKLTGLQRELIIFMSENCRQTRSKCTDTLTLEHLESSLKRNKDVIKTTIKRLEKKGCLIRIDYKIGRGGWSQYQIPEDIYLEAIQFTLKNIPGLNWEQTGNKLGTESGTESGTNASSSSSDLNITTTTELPHEWNFDISAYSRFGFTKAHIKQLVFLDNIQASNVEQSLIEFSHDLDNNSLPHIKTGKINFLMGLLRAGHTYVSETYRNEQQELISEMAKRAEKKRKTLIEEKFIAWEDSLSEEQRKEIQNKLPPQLMVLHHAHGIDNPDIKSWLFDFYLKNYSTN